VHGALRLGPIEPPLDPVQPRRNEVCPHVHASDCLCFVGLVSTQSCDRDLDPGQTAAVLVHLGGQPGEVCANRSEQFQDQVVGHGDASYAIAI
jgi:hypothetical protein